MVNKRLFREYIGAQWSGVGLNYIPRRPDIEIHIILAFAVDYTNTKPPEPPVPNNGQFEVFFDTRYITPDAILAIKQSHPNVKFVLSLGGHSVKGDAYAFKATTIDSWVSNAVKSLTNIIQHYHIDGIDIDYEKFTNAYDTDTFAECIGQLIKKLQEENIISIASIAPYNDPTVKNMYETLWQRYEQHINYVNFRFYAMGRNTTEQQYIDLYNEQTGIYGSEKIIASLSTGVNNVIDPTVGLDACQRLHDEKRLNGIFIWSADSSFLRGFKHHGFEDQAQMILYGENP